MFLLFLFFILSPHTVKAHCKKCAFFWVKKVDKHHLNVYTIQYIKSTQLTVFNILLINYINWGGLLSSEPFAPQLDHTLRE